MFNQRQNSQIPLDNRSLTVAFANLLQKFETTHHAPAELHTLLTADDPTIDFWSLAEYIDEVEIGDVKDFEGCGWPDTSNAIVRFRRMDEEAAGPIDHYCAIADHHRRSIIDSIDGVIKSGDTYGEPLGWASYIQVEPDPELAAIEQAAIAAAPKNHYVLTDGENIWDVGRKFNIKVADLCAYNGITDDPRSIKAGYVLRIPASDAKGKDMVNYEVLEKPVPMHVTKEDGTQKLSFGNARSWADIQPTSKHYAHNANLLIAAIAHVELEKEGVTAAYYMDAMDFGDFARMGRVHFTVGFNHTHLGEGHVVETKEPLPVSDLPSSNLVHPAETKLEPPMPPVERAVDVLPPPPPPPAWQNTFVPLNMDSTPVTYIAQQDVIVRELQGKRTARQLMRHRGVKIIGTFEKDGILYARPDALPFWFGIPMDMLVAEAELYNTNIPLAERASIKGGKLTFVERYWSVPFAKLVSQHVRIKAWLQNKQKAK